MNNYLMKPNGYPPTVTLISYVEKLLDTGIEDYRKNAISLILAPYFVNILKLSDEESFNKIKDWVLKCNDVKSLNPSIRDFDNIIKNSINRARITGVKPLKFKDTLQYKNKNLYNMLLSS
jgi:Primase X